MSVTNITCTLSININAQEKIMTVHNEMTTKEIKQATEKALHAMDRIVNEWAVRDTLCELTEFGFWEG